MTHLAKPKYDGVTVVVPFYNRTRYLTRLVRSVKGQTMFPTALLIVDNGSTFEEANAAWNIIQEECVSCPFPITLVSTLRRGNANFARNLGVDLANTEFIAFLDSDDWWEPDHLQNSVNTLANSNSAGVYSGAIVHKVKTKIEPSSDVNVSPTPFDFLFLQKSIAQTSSYVVKASELNGVVWDERLKRHQDYDYFLNIYYNATGGWVFESSPSSNVDWSEGGHGRIDFRSMVLFLSKWNFCFAPQAKEAYFLDQILFCARRNAHPMYYRYYRLQLHRLPYRVGINALWRSSRCYLVVRQYLVVIIRAVIAVTRKLKTHD